jgi:hypothetical protein
MKRQISLRWQLATVECTDINGTILWTFTDTSVLKAPRSIDVDEYGNVYVVGTDSVNVIVISPDGKEHRQLLSKADRLDDPRALHIKQLLFFY